MDAEMEQKIVAVRSFNRFFTRNLGVLQEGLLHSPYSLTESRILYEIANRENLITADLSRELGLDAGYLSRLLEGLERRGLIQKVFSKMDGRRRLLQLTSEGEKTAALLDERSREEIGEMLSRLSKQDQNRLIQSMNTIESMLDNGLKYAQPYFLRQHEPGDMGWVIQMHGYLYNEEYGWNEHFEALVAQICSDFITHFNSNRERCWIAEMDGQVAGSVFVVQDSEKVAKIRLLLVDPKARGLGLGSRLVEECIRFAKRKGYEKLALWTNSILVTARRIYSNAGFRLVHSEPHHSFGQDLVGETWEMLL